MRLKSVRIFGFKTFAEKTEFNVDGDLIAIVGPNGCGKSNIVDAIMWALGEPNVRNIRGQTGLDVIFNGSEKRKALGYAEVTLTFENEDGQLPIPAAEVAISRKLTRAGDSSYSINQKSCRLKDVHDLLADSGLGLSGFAIVTQRQIDQALSASAEERRAWVDEAAGVQRFRKRRIESVKRLEDAREHLQRVESILGDIESQRTPLEAEAILARQYLQIKDQLVRLETGLLVEEVCLNVQLATELDAKAAETMLRVSQETQRHAELESEIERIGHEIAETERKFDAIRELRQQYLTEAERADANGSMCQLRLESIEEVEKSISQELETNLARKSQFEEELKVFRAEAEAAIEALNSLQKDSPGVETQRTELISRQREIETALEEARQLELRAAELQSAQAQAKQDCTLLKREIDGIERALPGIEEGVEAARTDAEKLSSDRNTLIQRLAQLRESDESVQRAREEHERSRRAHLNQISVMEGRAKGIEATIDAHEGLSQGSAAVLSLVAKDELPNAYMPVAEAVSVRANLGIALEVALGAAGNDLIVRDESLAERAIQLLKDRRLGRATFQPVSLMKPYSVSSDLKQAASRPGILGIAAELVEVADEHRPVINSLLGRILVANTLDDALRLKSTSGWNRIVTVDGEVLHHAGSISGGRSNRQGNGMIHRKAELSDIQSQLEKCRTELKRLDGSTIEFDRQSEAIKADVSRIQSDLAAMDVQVREADKWLGNLISEFESTHREKSKIERDLARVSEVLERAAIAVPDREKWAEEHRNVVVQLAQVEAEMRHSGDQVRVAEMHVEQAQRRLAEAQRRVSDFDKVFVDREARQQQIERERGELKGRLAHSQTQAIEASQRANELAIELDEIAERRREFVEANHTLSLQSKDIQKEIVMIGDTMRMIEVERARVDSKRAASVQRLTEEYGYTQEDALEMLGQDEVPEDAAKLVGRWRRELREMGTVNLGAVEAYERLTERFDELNNQYQDVIQSAFEIESAIKELEGVTRDRFLTTFEKVREAFKEYFVKLFEGGDADIQLSESESILSAGIDIEVTIPGKKRQKLELLSGGERSLCACAFLFALLKVHPSPLVVLDEVDAPLDGRNVERFIDVLHEFAEITQFLLITHNPVTIEAAPIWFGVTNREPGVSTILPFRAPELASTVQNVVNDAFLVAPTSS